MTKISAYIDASSYAHSVCDYAAWVAGRTGGAVEALHVIARREMHGDCGDLSGALDLDARDTACRIVGPRCTESLLAQKRGRLILDQTKKRLETAGVANVATKLRILPASTSDRTSKGWCERAASRSLWHRSPVQSPQWGACL